MSGDFAHPTPPATVADPGRGVHDTSHGAFMLRRHRARSPGNRRPGPDAHGRAPTARAGPGCPATSGPSPRAHA
eukprot:11576275-Alexandrium_andersonii.AAC.1